MADSLSYRGRLAPSPTGYLHVGHARTFSIAAARAKTANGTLLLRNDDLDRSRCRPEFVAAMLEDLNWLGFHWTEGPDVGGPFAPYNQSERLTIYRRALEKLHRGGHIFPCARSRQDVINAAGAPHEDDDEAVYPAAFRPDAREKTPALSDVISINWRFRVPDGETLSFIDGQFSLQTATAGKDFGDFLVWRKDDIPSYQLACTVDDAAMGVTEVVRGADLLRSTFRQLLLYRALALQPPVFYHCPLMTDKNGNRLAKRHDALSIRTLREAGKQAEDLLQFNA